MQLGQRIRRDIFVRGLMSPWGIVFLFLMAIGVSCLVYLQYYLVVAGFIAALVGSIVLFVVFFRPLIGFYVVSLMAAFAFWPGHIIHVELGISTLVELLVWILLLGSLREKPPEGIKNNLSSSPITVMMIIYTFYNLLQFFNPDLTDRTQYYLVLRKVFMFLWIYIIAYRLVNTPEKFRFFIKFWFIIAFLAAAYGCYQQWFGFLPGELQFVMNNPVLYALNFQGGQLRKFSFMSDVSQFGIFSSSMCVFTLVIAIYEERRRRKFFLFFAALIMALGMSYSGTRTATFTLLSGLSLYVLITIRNKATLVTIFSFIMIGLFVFFAPIYSNKSLNRLRSSFDSKDASLDVRNINRRFIQPYMHAHPFGGGIGTTGYAGYLRDPRHPLADFPPDSGLLEIGLEVGWIGLVITIVWYLIILYTYIYTAFKIRSPEFRTYTIALACFLFSIIVAQYSQTAIGQIPMVILYLSSIAIVKRLLEFERLNLYPD